MNASAQSASGWSSRALVFTSASISAIGASVLSVVGAGVLWSYQTDRSERAADATKFIDVSQQFDRTVSDFMTPFLVGKDDAAQREILRKNIQDQFLAIERASTSLPLDRYDNIKRYQATLVTVGTELDKKLPAPEARALVQAIADAKEASVCVTFDLRKAASMSVSDADAEYCAPSQSQRSENQAAR